MASKRAAGMLRLARLPLGGGLAGLAVERWADRLPFERVYCDERVVAFHHPSPSYATHVVIVPRRRIATLLDLDSRGNMAYVGDVFRAVHAVLRDLGLRFDFVTLVANGGSRQEVRQLHFHLITGGTVVTPLPHAASRTPVMRTPQVVVSEHPFPNWETHLIVQPRRERSLSGALTRPPIAELAALFGILPELDRRYGLSRRGYSVCIQGRGEAERARLTLHVVAGERIDVAGEG